MVRHASSSAPLIIPTIIYAIAVLLFFSQLRIDRHLPRVRPRAYGAGQPIRRDHRVGGPVPFRFRGLELAAHEPRRLTGASYLGGHPARRSVLPSRRARPSLS